MLRKVATCPSSLTSLEASSKQGAVKPYSTRGHRRTSSSPTPFASPFVRRSQTCAPPCALPNIELPVQLGAILTRIEDQIVLESSLHVPSVAAAQCEAQFGFTRLPSAPSLTDDDVSDTSDASSLVERGIRKLLEYTAHQDTTSTDSDSTHSSGSPRESKRALAACLATPFESEESVRSRAAAITNVNRTLALCQLEEQAASVMQYVNRHYELTRRVRRQRRAQAVKSLLATLAAFPLAAISAVAGGLGRAAVK